VLDEVKEIIELPQFDVASVEQEVATSQMQLNPQVIPEVKLFVKCIAERYQRNPFHNFEHASHVTMSVVKLLSRISNTGDDRGEKSHAMRSQHHLDTYGITSDPLTCFGCVFSALIHDVDHPGVSNAQLVAEGGPLVKLYAGKSVAEQNSVDIAWTLLSESRFANFREAIFANEEELVRFRQVLVNSVMATDIMDKELKQLRDSRWDKAFHDKKVVEESVAAYPGGKIEDCLNRKATIVIEHLIQASDVSHTMQHWHVYREWNEKLYVEMYQAYKDGRSPTDPTIGWYQGEIGFFDYYIIPLAKKLADCGVFGACFSRQISSVVIARLAFAERHISYCFASRHVYLSNRRVKL
jgi:3'5'-cyclic nucleotide phosphodiesterase